MTTLKVWLLYYLSDEVSGAYSCNVNSPRSTPKAFMANAPISSSPGITTIGARLPAIHATPEYNNH